MPPMRINYLLLGLVTVTMVVGLYMADRREQGDTPVAVPQQVGLTGDTREIVMTILALGLAAFVGYLAITRRN
jgi:hypothetical protein